MIRQLTLDGKLVNTYKNLQDAERATGIDNSNISKVILGKYKHTGGFLWDRVEGDVEIDKFEQHCLENDIPIEEVSTVWHKSKQYSVKFKPSEITFDDKVRIISEATKKAQPIGVDAMKSKVDRIKCAVFNIYDLHLDKMPYWYNGDSRGHLESTMSEIERACSNIIDQLFNMDIHTIVLPIGNDILTTNGFVNTTKGGTPQEPFIPHHIAFERVITFLCDLIETLSPCCDELYIPIIRGNHDDSVCFYIGQVLSHRYHNCDKIKIEKSLDARKNKY